MLCTILFYMWFNANEFDSIACCIYMMIVYGDARACVGIQSEINGAVACNRQQQQLLLLLVCSVTIYFGILN